MRDIWLVRIISSILAAVTGSVAYAEYAVGNSPTPWILLTVGLVALIYWIGPEEDE